MQVRLWEDAPVAVEPKATPARKPKAAAPALPFGSCPGSVTWLILPLQERGHMEIPRPVACPSCGAPFALYWAVAIGLNAETGRESYLIPAHEPPPPP